MSDKSVKELEKELHEKELITALLACEIGYKSHEKGFSLWMAQEQIRASFRKKEPA